MFENFSVPSAAILRFVFSYQKEFSIISSTEWFFNPSNKSFIVFEWMRWMRLGTLACA